MTRLPEGDRSASRNVIRAMRLTRQKRGISCQKLSDQLRDRGVNISRAVLANQENGVVQGVSIDQAVALAAVLDVSIERLIRPTCETCANTAPPGFTCNSCGLSGETP